MCRTPWGSAWALQVYGGKSSRLAVESVDKGAVAHGNDDLNYWGYWRVVDRKEDADYVVDYKIERIGTHSFKGYVQIKDARSNAVVFATRSVNTVMSMRGFNHKLTIIRRLTEMIKEQAK